jgi:hypothetical protein
VAAILLMVILLVAACSGDGTSKAKPADQPQAIPVQSAPGEPFASPQASPANEAEVPNPVARRSTADELLAVESSLENAIETWLNGGPRRPVEVLALRQQRIYRKLVRDPKLAARTIGQLQGDNRRRVGTHVAVAASLRANVQPIEPPVDLETTHPAPPNELLRYFKRAGRRFRIRWTVLAGINFVETRFGRITGPSSAGALGPMQFLPATWDRYGAGGDVHDPRDSIFGAARFLRVHRIHDDVRNALLGYNNSDAYADAVLMYARHMERNVHSYFGYYFWQVFVVTTEGDDQLTGPGAARR